MSALTAANEQGVALQSAAAQAFDLLQREGKMLASSNLVPDIYKGKVADCAIIVEMAHRIGASPLLVANNLDIIYGRTAWRSQFLIACVNTCGRFTTLKYEWRGTAGQKDRACRAWAKDRETQERVDGAWIDWKMVEAEGWSTKKGSKWLTMAEQMFVYRAAAFWTRAYAPEITMGLPTGDEVRDTIDVTPRPESSVVAQINAQIAGRGAQGDTIEGELSMAGEQATTDSPTAAARKAIAGAATLEALDLARSLIKEAPEADRAALEDDATERFNALQPA